MVRSRAACMLTALLLCGACADLDDQMRQSRHADAGEVQQLAQHLGQQARSRSALARSAETELSRGNLIAGDPRDPPDGYLAVQPFATAGSKHSDAVVLVEPNDGTVLPIFVGGSEALSIRLRLAEKRFKRPLTHDLLDA